MQLGICMLSAYNKYQSQFGKSEKLMTEDGKFNDAVGEKIGIAMAIACPDIILAMSNNEKSSSATTNEKYAVEEKFSTKVVGTFNGLVTDEYNNVVVTDESGKKQSLIWFEYFPNADWFIENMEKLKNKKLTIYYTEKEVYSSKLKKHIIQKVINNIEEKSE